MSFSPVEEQLALIHRGVEKIVPEQELAEKLQQSREAGTPLRVKYGIDPTGAHVHLGHTVPLRKMRQFQQLGHQAVIIIGNYTARVGDPSGRDETRPRMTADQVEANAAEYLAQVGRVLDLQNAEIVHNGDWFANMNFADILELCSTATVAQLLTRDDFSKRMKSETAIYLHECLYPVMQAFDSVVVAADVELGGTEQLYSFMLARDLQKDASACQLAERFQSEAAKARRRPGGRGPQQIGVMSPILVGLDGVRRMGKSLGNFIGISEPPYEMMKKFMQLPDDCMRTYFELLTDLPLEQVDSLLAGHPKEAKQRLAQSIIGEFHDAAAAQEATKRWEREIAQKELPTDIKVVPLEKRRVQGPRWIVKLISGDLHLVSSGSEARRQIKQGSVWINERTNRKTDSDEEVEVTDGMIVGVGKRKVVRVKLVD